MDDMSNTPKHQLLHLQQPLLHHTLKIKQSVCHILHFHQVKYADKTEINEYEISMTLLYLPVEFKNILNKY